MCATMNSFVCLLMFAGEDERGTKSRGQSISES